jgi:hypothetical protein
MTMPVSLTPGTYSCAFAEKATITSPPGIAGAYGSHIGTLTLGGSGSAPLLSLVSEDGITLPAPCTITTAASESGPTVVTSPVQSCPWSAEGHPATATLTGGSLTPSADGFTASLDVDFTGMFMGVAFSGTGWLNGDCARVPETGAPEVVRGSGVVFGYTSTTDPGTPLLGVAVCVADHPEIACVATDARGLFIVPGLPANADVALSFTQTGYYGIVLPTHTPAVDFRTNAEFSEGLVVEALWAQFFKTAGWTYPDPAQGVLHVHASKPGGDLCHGAAMTTFTTSTAVPPVYANTCVGGPGTADPTLTAATIIGDAFFLAAPGPIDVTATNPTLTCGSAENGWGWTSTRPGTGSGVVVAGHETVVYLGCN